MQEANELRDQLTTEFAEKYMEKLFYFCLKKTGSHAQAEDLTQDIALQIITALNKGTIPTNFSAWIWQIARNRYSVCAKEKHNRNESVTGSDIDDYEIEDESENILDEMIHSEQIALLRRELAFIKSDYRNIVVAYYIENKSVRDIASSLSLSISAVQQRLHRARIILKEGMNMAREFGKRSYHPERFTYSVDCINPGALGQPWSLLESKLNQNVFLSCYDNPMTVEELAIEVGVAMPYMEDTVKYLTEQTLLVCKNDKYETNYPIISRDAQEKIYFYYEGIMPRLVQLLTENTDHLMEQFCEAGICCFGPYVSYEEAKWTLLMRFYKELYTLCQNSPKAKWGNTKRRQKGIWDVVGFEICELMPPFVGCHCSPDAFSQYRFSYADIHKKTPEYLSKEETNTLKQMIENRKIENTLVADKLVQYGYACKTDGRYLPHVIVFSYETEKTFRDFCEKQVYSSAFQEHTNKRKELIEKTWKLIEEINKTVRQILLADLPECIRSNRDQVDALLGSICEGNTRGYIVKQALEINWLHYDNNTTPVIGSFFTIPERRTK